MITMHPHPGNDSAGYKSQLERHPAGNCSNRRDKKTNKQTNKQTKKKKTAAAL